MISTPNGPGEKPENRVESQGGITNPRGDRERMMDSILSEDTTENGDILAQEKAKKKKRNTIIIAGSAVAVVAALATTAFTVGPLGGDQKVGTTPLTSVSATPTPSASASKSSEESEKARRAALAKETLDTSADFWLQPGKEYPVKLEKWQMKPYVTQKSDPNTVKQVLNLYSSTGIASAAGTLPSEASGYTSDSSKEYLEDKSINPMFSYWTQESFERQVETYTERLINPVFGGWDRNQYSAYPGNRDFDVTNISDMFTDRWKTENASKKYSEYVPVYADWDGNDYGMKDRLLASGSRWIGQVSESSSDFTYDETKQQYTVKMTTKVTFTAWDKDANKIEKKGTLVLDLVSNADNENSSKNTVLIDGATLTMDE